ncbi:MAG: nitroreductase family deazaflavin-dependent oxidoreductase [Microbacteriaceae bacterium]|nr:nitroreductase family deazaflavin-dependent oxidoreductase [Microbacteriaceae bacterium]
MTEEKGASPDNPVDNSEDWIAAHIKEFDEPSGSGWPTQGGAPLLLLTTKGAKSGLWRRTVLIYGEDAGRFLIVASKGGAPKAPGWFANLSANPEVYLQVEDRKFKAIASTATMDEKPKLWDEMVSIWPDYANYQKKTERDIPVVVLTPMD